MSPRISVLMSVYNGERFLGKAIESILGQTFTEFEFIILDDGSVDSTPNLIAHYQQRDTRILFRRFDNNHGLSAALNFGINLARGEYIARMDADDISISHRLQTQYDFLRDRPDIKVCGSSVRTSDGRVWSYPINHDDIQCRMLFMNGIAHPTAFLDRKFFIENQLFYNEKIRYAQDYELWTRAMKVAQLANLSEPLILYANDKIKPEQNIGQRSIARQIHGRMLGELGVSYTEQELEFHTDLGFEKTQGDKKFVLTAEQWLVRILLANQVSARYSKLALEKELHYRWSIICDRADQNKWLMSKLILFSRLKYGESKGPIASLKYLKRRLLV